MWYMYTCTTFNDFSQCEKQCQCTVFSGIQVTPEYVTPHKGACRTLYHSIWCTSALYLVHAWWLHTSTVENYSLKSTGHYIYTWHQQHNRTQHTHEHTAYASAKWPQTCFLQLRCMSHLKNRMWIWCSKVQLIFLCKCCQIHFVTWMLSQIVREW